MQVPFLYAVICYCLNILFSDDLSLWTSVLMSAIMAHASVSLKPIEIGSLEMSCKKYP